MLHSQSSSIAINDTKIGESGNTSALTLHGGLDASGNAKDNNVYYDTAGGRVEVKEGNYIAGSVYINYGLDVTMKTNGLSGTATVTKDGQWTYRRNGTGPASYVDDSFWVTVSNAFGGARDQEIKISRWDERAVVSSSDASVGEDRKISVNYQTGDSVSIAGNFNAYSQVLSDETVDGYAAHMGSGATIDKGKYSGIPIENFEDVPPLTVVKKGKDGANLTVDEKALYARMARYQESPNLYTAAPTPDPADVYFNFGNQKIKIHNIRYSLGNFIETRASDGVSDFQAMKTGANYMQPVNGEMGIAAYGSKYSGLMTLKEKEYRYQVNRMGNPQLVDIYKNSYDLDQQDNMESFYTFPEEQLLSNQGMGYGDANPLYFASKKDDTTAFVLKGPGSMDLTGIVPASARTVSLGNEKLKGIIICGGDVYLSGRLDYTGIILAKGSIYIVDDQKKVFSNDFNPDLMTFNTPAIGATNYDRLIDSISNNLVIKKIVQDSLSSGVVELGDLFKKNELGSQELVYVKESDADILAKDAVKTYTNRLDKYIAVSQWKKIE